MLSRTITLASLLDARVLLSWREAVALAQGIAELSEQSASPGCADSLSQMALDPAGVVIAPTSGNAAISRSELALFLVQLLPPDSTDAREPTPPQLYEAISRALGLSGEQAFETVAEFSAALKQFERGSRRAVLRSVYARCMQHLDYTVHTATAAGRQVADPPGAGNAERRRTGTQVVALRRMLRELDREAYLMRAAVEARRNPAKRGGRALSTFTPLCALALAVLVTAAAGTAQRRQMDTPPGASSVRLQLPSAASGDVRPSAMIENPPKPAEATVANSAPDAFRSTAATISSGLNQSTPSRHPRVRRAADRPGAHPRRPDATRAQRIEANDSTPVAGTTRRWPRRLIAAIGHRLSSAFHGA